MKSQRIKQIFEAIETVTGVDRKTIASRSRVREHFFARIIASHHLKDAGFPPANICSLVGATSSSTITYQIKVYRRERTPYFRRCADEVEKILIKTI